MTKKFNTHSLVSGLAILVLIICTLALLKGLNFFAPAVGRIDHAAARHAEATSAPPGKGSQKEVGGDQSDTAPQPPLLSPRDLAHRIPQPLSSQGQPREEQDSILLEDLAVLPVDEQEDPERTTALEESMQFERAEQEKLDSKEVAPPSDQEVTTLEAEINERILEEDFTRDMLPNLSSDKNNPDPTMIE